MGTWAPTNKIIEDIPDFTVLNVPIFQAWHNTVGVWAKTFFCSSPPSATYMHQWTGSALVQIMACCLFEAKPLPEPMLVYRQLDPWEQVSVKFEWEFYHFLSRKYIWKCILPKWWPFCLGGDELVNHNKAQWCMNHVDIFVMFCILYYITILSPHCQCNPCLLSWLIPLQQGLDIFHEQFLLTIQVLCKIFIAIIQLLAIKSLKFFCTCHDSYAVVSWAKFCCNHLFRIGNIVKQYFHQI